jgi:hypothetical protein
MEPFFDFPSGEHESSNTTNVGGTHKYKSAAAGPVFDFGNNDLLPGFEFQAGVESSRSSTQADNRARRSLSPPPLRPKRDNPSSYDQAGHTEKESVEWAIVVATVERTMKKYADNLLHVLEGMSGRLSQLEFNSQRIEHTVQEFKVESADKHGAADGKLRSLENMIREVQRGVQVLRDKQEIAEEQLKLAKLQLASKVEAPASAAAPIQAIVEVQPQTPKQVETSLALAPPSSGQQTDPAIYHLQQLQNQHQLQLQQQQLQAVSATQQQIPQQISQQMPQQQQPQLQPQAQQQNALLIRQQQAHQQVPPQHPQQLQLQATPLTAQPEHQYQPQALSPPPQLQPQQLTHQIGQQQAEQPQHLLQLQYQHLQQQAGQSEAQHQPQQLQPQLQASHQPQLQHQHPQQPQIQYQQPRTQPQPQLFYSQQQSGTPPPMQPQYGNVQSDIPSYSSQSLAKYSPENPPAYMPEGYGNRPFPQPLPQMQQSSNLSSAQMYDPSRNNRGGLLALPPPYHPEHTTLPVYENYTPYGYRMSSSGTNPLVPNTETGGYARLPTAQPVTSGNNSNNASNTGSSAGTTPLSTNRVAISEVIDKVASMGFSKDQVQVVIRKLTENGQSVDLNIVLDKLMNGGGDPAEVQPQKGWFNR